MKIYIRHGEKAYRNNGNGTLPLDPPLTEKGEPAIKQHFRFLLGRYGPPDIIITSPFLRTRQTATIAQDILREDKNHAPPIYCDPEMGEFIGKYKLEPESITTETASYHVIYPEKREEYNSRVEAHCQRTYNNQTNVWYITHGFFIQKVAKYYGTKIRTREYLSTLFIDNNHVPYVVLQG